MIDQFKPALPQDEMERNVNLNSSLMLLNMKGYISFPTRQRLMNLFFPPTESAKESGTPWGEGSSNRGRKQPINKES